MAIPKRRPRALRLALTLLLVVVVSAAIAPGPAAASEPSFCKRRTLHDYLAPLRLMPKLREEPFRRRAEPIFHGVDIGSAGPPLAINGGRAGYQFQWNKNPGWDLTLTFAQVSRKGAVIRQIGRRHIRLGALAPALITEPSFAMPGRPAFYRTILVIRTRSGHELGEFGNYYRVVKPRIDAQLVADAPSYAPGETVFARIENPGAAVVLFGDEVSVEQDRGESWVPAPVPPSTFSAPLYNVAAGATGNHCDVYPIPAAMPPGHYRLAQETVMLWASEHHERRPVLYAEFGVTAP